MGHGQHLGRTSVNGAISFGITLVVDLHMLGRAEGGRATPVTSGYRPLCRFTSPDREATVVGMCQLELVDVSEVEPGQSGRGLLRFAPAVSQTVRELAEGSSEILLEEGTHVVGSAHVIGSIAPDSAL